MWKTAEVMPILSESAYVCACALERESRNERRVSLISRFEGEICTYNCSTGKSCGGKDEQGCHGSLLGKTIGGKMKMPMAAYVRLHARQVEDDWFYPSLDSCPSRIPAEGHPLTLLTFRSASSLRRMLSIRPASIRNAWAFSSR
jgi:hypothetical protein